MSESANIVAATATRIFADFGDLRTINRAEDDGWKESLWQALASAGLTLAWVPVEHGGAGASLAVAGRFAVAVPLAETLLAGWLLSRGGLDAPSGAMTVAPARPGDRIALAADRTLSGRARGVPFAREAHYVAVLANSADSTSIALVNTAACRTSEGRTLAGDTMSDVTFDRVEPIGIAPAPSGFDQRSLMLMGAMA